MNFRMRVRKHKDDYRWEVCVQTETMLIPLVGRYKKLSRAYEQAAWMAKTMSESSTPEVFVAQLANMNKVASYYDGEGQRLHSPGELWAARLRLLHDLSADDTPIHTATVEEYPPLRPVATYKETHDE